MILIHIFLFVCFVFLFVFTDDVWPYQKTFLRGIFYFCSRVNEHIQDGLHVAETGTRTARK